MRRPRGSAPVARVTDRPTSPPAVSPRPESPGGQAQEQACARRQQRRGGRAGGCPQGGPCSGLLAGRTVQAGVPPSHAVPLLPQRQNLPLPPPSQPVTHLPSRPARKRSSRPARKRPASRPARKRPSRPAQKRRPRPTPLVRRRALTAPGHCQWSLILQFFLFASSAEKGQKCRRREQGGHCSAHRLHRRYVSSPTFTPQPRSLSALLGQSHNLTAFCVYPRASRCKAGQARGH